jgi:phytoene desaturase
MRVVVIGAGVGGMSAALRLARAGHEVTVVEQGDRVGGKLNVWEQDVPGIAGRFRFDTGPHVLTMPWAIRELFDDLGERMEDWLDLVRMDPICRYHFADGSTFDAPADPAEAARRVAAQFPGDEDGFRALLAYARRVHDVTVDPFLRQDFSSAVRGVPTPEQWRQLGQFVGLAPWKALHDRVRAHLRHPRLQQIFDLYAFYNGSSPLKASGIFAIIAWVQWGDGTYYLRGGLRTYADALTGLAKKLAVDVRLNTAVESVCVDGQGGRGRVTGVALRGGGCLPADAIICNADPLTAYERLVPEAHRPPAFTDEGLARLEPSTSAFVMLLGVRGTPERDFPHLSHFNSFLPDDTQAETEAVFGRCVPGDDPVIGVTCQGVTEPEAVAPPGHTTLFVMTSPPALGPHWAWTPENTAQYREQLFNLLETRCGMAGLRERIVCEQVWTPETFATRYGAWRGSLYGLSSNGWRSAFLRPPNRAKGVTGLYFVGGGTHPGGGLPLVTLGGKIVADAVQTDLRNKKICPAPLVGAGLHHPDGQ